MIPMYIKKLNVYQKTMAERNALSMDQMNECENTEQQQSFLAVNQRVEHGWRYRRLFWSTVVLFMVVGTGFAIIRLPRHSTIVEQNDRRVSTTLIISVSIETFFNVILRSIHHLMPSVVLTCISVIQPMVEVVGFLNASVSQSHVTVDANSVSF